MQENTLSHVSHLSKYLLAWLASNGLKDEKLLTWLLLHLTETLVRTFGPILRRKYTVMVNSTALRTVYRRLRLWQLQKWHLIRSRNWLIALFFRQVWEGHGRMCLGTLHERRLLPQLCEPFRVRVRLELLRHLLPDGRQRLLPVHLPGPVAESLPAGVVPCDPLRRRAGDRVGLSGQRLRPTEPETGPEN